MSIYTTLYVSRKVALAKIEELQGTRKSNEELAGILFVYLNKSCYHFTVVDQPEAADDEIVERLKYVENENDK